MTIVLGIDVGSLSTKTVILDQEQRILAYDVLLTVGDSKRAAQASFKNVLNKAKLTKDDISYVVATGYGRNNVPFADTEVTEITCHAKGAHFLHPEARTVLDIGGQDSKAISLDPKGQITDFVMNDKCAAGTGRFIEVMAQALGVSLGSLGNLSRQATKSAQISSFCTVFAESEVVSLVAEGRTKVDIVGGIHDAIAERIFTLLNRIQMVKPVIMTGGVAMNKGVVRSIENKLDLKLNIPDHPQVVGALGAALVALGTFSKLADFLDVTEKL